MPRHSLSQALTGLLAHGAKLFVVGGVAAVLQGAPVHTFDLDIVYAEDPASIARLLHFSSRCDAGLLASWARRGRLLWEKTLAGVCW